MFPKLDTNKANKILEWEEIVEVNREGNPLSYFKPFFCLIFFIIVREDILWAAVTAKNTSLVNG